MLFWVEQAFVGREEIRAPLKTPAWEATKTLPRENEVTLQQFVPGPTVFRKIIGQDEDVEDFFKTFLRDYV